MKEQLTQQGRKHLVERKWAVSNLSKEHLGFRLRHAMPPMIVGDLLVQGNSIDGIAVYQKSSGQILWKKEIKGGVEGGVAVSNGVLFFGAGDGLLYALNLIDGKLRWTFPLRFEGLSAPTVDGSVLYITTGNDIVYAIETKTGSKRWAYKRRISSNFSVRGGSRPAISGKRVYVGFSDGYIVALNKRTGSLSWERSINSNRRFKDVDSHPVINGNRLYISSYDDNFYCLDKDTGNVIWASEFGGHSKALIAKNKIFLPSSHNKLVALDKKSGKTLWQFQSKGLATTPQLHKGALIFGESKGHLKFLDSNTGEEFDNFWPGRGVSSAPTIDPSSGDIYFLSVDANIYALKRKWKRVTDYWPWEKNN